MQQLKRIRSRRDSERGAVIVLVAIWLPVLAIFVSFAVDYAHFYDYSRNLQNRADAAALGALVAYGNTCFGSPGAATTDSIGQVAQQYAGPPSGASYTSGLSGQLPYPYSTFTAAQYKNVPNLTRGTSTNFGMRLNSNQNWPNGQNWSMGSSGHTGNSTALCSSTDEDGNTGAMIDVRLTQRNLALFFGSLFHNFTPTINAHARGALEGESSSPSAPIAVGDSGSTPCASIKIVNAATNTVMQTVPLAKKTPVNPSDPVQWDNTLTPAAFTMPASANVYIQPFLSDCNGNGQTYDDSTNTGLEMIDNYPSPAPTVTNGNAPQLQTNGVIVFGSCPTPYFSPSGAACTVEVDAFVAFAPNVGKNDQNLTLVQHQWDNTIAPNGAFTTTLNAMHPSGNGANACQNTSAWCTSVTIPDSSGIDQFSLNWTQTAGSINGGTTPCGDGKASHPAPCTGQINNGGILQQVFGACNGCDQPDDSGPIVYSQISEANGAGVITGTDTNSFAGGSTHNLVFTIKLSGVNTSAPTDPPIVLRFAASSNHQTGLIDCGQGNGASADAQVVYYGCGPNNPLIPGMNPLYINSRNTCGTPPGPPWPNTNQQDCVQTTPGQRRVAIICPMVERIVGAPFGGNCNNGSPGTCPTNHWTTQDIPEGDPRAITMIITSDVDLAAAAGSPQAWIPIRRFATFYVTGWDTSMTPSCTANGPSKNEAFPVKGHKNQQNGAVWGHWINYVDSAGTPSGQLCTVSVGSPTNCVPALTR